MSLLYQWQKADLNQTAQLKQLAQKLQLPLFVVQLLNQRGIQTSQEIQQFLQPDLKQLADPYLLHDMQPAIDRITQAIVSGEQILIYGDYDADGITSTTILTEAITNLGGQVDYFIPDRFQDGYGPNLKRYQQFIAQGVQLIITVDNGITGVQEVEYANAHGVDVIITDHHTLPKQLPAALAIVHPALTTNQQAAYPCPYLSGAGVAFKVASALLEEVPVDLLDLAAIGTIADVMELVGENRVIVTFGLQQMKTQERIGLAALAKVAHLNWSTFNEDDIAFQIAPRLNALGRLDQAQKGVDLLLTFDEEQAQSLAKTIDQFNQQRKDLTQEVFTAAWQQAQAQLAAGQHVLVLAAEDWHQGILGVVAGKVLQQSGCPTLVFHIDEHQVATGSGRSNEQFDLYTALASQADLYQKFGGHAQACGLTLDAALLEQLKQRLNQLPQALQLDLTQKPQQTYDLTVAAPDLSLDFYQQLRRLAPFGQGNPQPMLKIINFQHAQVEFLGKKTQTHLKFLVDQHLECLAFNWGQYKEQLAASAIQVLYGTVMINNWHRQPTVQLKVVDVKLANELEQLVVHQQQFIDAREISSLGQISNTTPLIFFQEKNRQRFVQQHDDYLTYLASAEVQQLKTAVLMDCPPHLQDFNNLIVKLPQLSRLIFILKNQLHPLIITPQQWHLALKYLVTHQQLRVQDLPVVAQYLKLNNSQIKLIIKVFSELKFVTIDSGLLKWPATIPAHQLNESALYQQNQAQLKIVQTLIDADFQQLVQYVIKLQS